MKDQHQKPIEIYCPVCGFKTMLNDPDESWSKLTREEKVTRIQELQKSDKPFFSCSGCSDPKAASMLEIR